jgi:hypothetical protein
MHCVHSVHVYIRETHDTGTTAQARYGKDGD